MNFIEILKAIFSALFGGKTEEAKTEEHAADTAEPAAEQTIIKTAEETTGICPIPVDNNRYVPGTRMMKSTFDFAVCDEPSQTAKDYVKTEMQRLDPLNQYPYTISTDKNIYTVHLNMDAYDNDRTAEFGTACDITPKHN